MPNESIVSLGEPARISWAYLSYEMQHLALDLKVIFYCVFYGCLQKRFEENNRIPNTLSFPQVLIH